MVSNSSGRGNTIQYDTASTTIAIATGLIVELDSSGDVVLPTTTPANPVGVSATAIAARTTATAEKIVVQVAGVAALTCAANEAFSYNGPVQSASANGNATTAATYAGTTFGSEDMRKVIGRAVTIDATTEGTTVVVALNIL